jgi:hypothetical protein
LAQRQSDLREFIALLNSHKVEYLVVGRHAVAFHGHPRFTGDTAACQVVQLGGSPNRIDLVTSISGVDFDSAWLSRAEATPDDQPVSFIGWKALLRNKEASGREKDRADVVKLRALAKRKGAG